MLKFWREKITGAIRQAENAKDHNIVVLIGNAGTGKSTAVNSLPGGSVVWDKEHQCMKVEGEVAKIGHRKATSKTIYTNVYLKHPIEGTKLVWADAEGVLDSRGTEHENIGIPLKF